MNPITVGKLIDLSNKSVKVKDGLGNILDIPIKKLSRQSSIKAKNIFNSRIDEQEKLINVTKSLRTLSKLSEKKLERTLNSIIECGISIDEAEKFIAPIATTNANPELAETALLAFLAVAPVNENAIQISEQILSKNDRLRIAISLRPEKFFYSLIRFKEHGELPILFAAMNGRVRLVKIDQQSIKKVELLTDVSGPANAIRAQAVFFLSQIDTDRSQNATFEVIRAAEQKINGQFDEATIKAAYAGFALGGFHLSEKGRYLDFSHKYRSVLPKLFDEWRKEHRSKVASQSEQRRLEQASKMRNFVDSRGNFLTRAQILKVSDDVVLFLDYKLDRRTIPLVNFSKSDQAWLRDLDL